MDKRTVEGHIDDTVEELYDSLSPEHCYALAAVVAAILIKGTDDRETLKLAAKEIVDVCGLYARVAISIRGLH